MLLYLLLKFAVAVLPDQELQTFYTNSSIPEVYSFEIFNDSISATYTNDLIENIGIKLTGDILTVSSESDLALNSSIQSHRLDYLINLNKLIEISGLTANPATSILKEKFDGIISNTMGVVKALEYPIRVEINSDIEVVLQSVSNSEKTLSLVAFDSDGNQVSNIASTIVKTGFQISKLIVNSGERAQKINVVFSIKNGSTVLDSSSVLVNVVGLMRINNIICQEGRVRSPIECFASVSGGNYLQLMVYDRRNNVISETEVKIVKTKEGEQQIVEFQIRIKESGTFRIGGKLYGEGTLPVHESISEFPLRVVH